jgi:hypothetical protein
MEVCDSRMYVDHAKAHMVRKVEILNPHSLDAFARIGRLAFRRPGELIVPDRRGIA